MNIIRIDNVKSTLSTSFSLTINIEKYKDLNKSFTIVILDEDDIENMNSLIKLKGIVIDTLIIPKKYKFTINETKYYDVLSTQFDKDYKITYY
jgi:hypothetical protein